MSHLFLMVIKRLTGSIASAMGLPTGDSNGLLSRNPLVSRGTIWAHAAWKAARSRKAATTRDIRDWPVTSLAVMQQFGSDRGESGHRADIVDRSKMTQPGHRLRLVPPLQCDRLSLTWGGNETGDFVHVVGAAAVWPVAARAQQPSGGRGDPSLHALCRQPP
jgi:hypothetical protein